MICSAVFYLFLYGGAASIAQNYLHYRGWVPTREWLSAGRLWLKSLCAMGAVLFFLWIFFILLSKKVSYLLDHHKRNRKNGCQRDGLSIPEEGMMSWQSSPHASTGLHVLRGSFASGSSPFVTKGSASSAPCPMISATHWLQSSPAPSI